MHREAVAARLLAAEHRTGLLHLGPDVLEAHRDLVHLHAEAFAEPVGHGRHVHRLHDRLLQPADLDQVPHEERIERQRRHELPVLVAEAGAVGVAVDGEPDIGLLARDAGEELIDVRRDGLRVHAAEVRVAFTVELDDLRLPAAQEPREVAAGRAVEGLADERVPRGLERFEVEELGDVREVVGRGIEPFDKPLLRGILGRHPLDPLGMLLERMDVRLDGLQHVWSGGRAGLGLHLEAVVHPRVVAGRDDDAGLRLPPHRGPRERLRRRRGGGEVDGDAVRRDDLGGGVGEEF